ncbi:MAG TPA: ATP-dependent endonuclease [bacterium]|mgnify:CR=1 FL=1|nr:ATP-dependent endonuclease [bacterium]
MIIESVRIKNYRSIKDATLYCDDMTVIVGPNGSGKSSFLKAIECFYHPSYVEKEDIYNNNTDKEIEIEVTYNVMSEKALNKFNSFIRNSKMTILLLFSYTNNKMNYNYSGYKYIFPKFNSIKMAQNATEMKTAYNQLQKEIVDLPTWKTKTKALEDISKWEEDNSDKCEWARDTSNFFGFSEVGYGYLREHSKLLFIPAVRDASEDVSTGKNSVLTQLLNMIVKGVVAQKPEVKELQEQVKSKLEELLNPKNVPELKILSENLTLALNTFVPNSGVKVLWNEVKEIELPFPHAEAKLAEDEYFSSVNRTGHGLQRAFILTLLQYLSTINEKQNQTDNDEEKEKLPSNIILIEEPELYQHPNRQRHFAKILQRLSQGQIHGVSSKNQIIYCTHSPLFVGIDRFDKIRLIKKTKENDQTPPCSKIVSTNLDKVADYLQKCCGKSENNFTAQSLRSRLATIMTPWMNEGFFSDVVVLVEGEQDRAAILGVAQSRNIDLESRGISVIPCNGKNNLDRPAIIFSQFGIPVYLIWDSDKGTKGANPGDNHKLLRIVKGEIKDWPNYIEPTFSCFEKKLEDVMKNDFGLSLLNEIVEKVKLEYEYKKHKDVYKNPYLMAEIIRILFESHSKESVSLNNIIEHIINLKDRNNNHN